MAPVSVTASLDLGITQHRATGLPPHAQLRLLLYLTVAYGFMLVYSQSYLLSHTSATSLALSNLAVQALTIIPGRVVSMT